MNHYPRHVGDYLRKTIGLTLAQDGAYTRMIDLYYSSEQILPKKPEIFQEIRCRSKSDREAVSFVLAKFFIETDDGYRHERCDEELLKYKDKSAKAKAAGEASGKARNNERTLNGRSTNVANPLNQPVTSNHKPEGQEQSGGAVAPPPAKRQRAMQLPKGWEIPAAWGDWAQRERPDWSSTDVLRVSLLFRDHWHSKAEARADWEATWRNWVRRERSQFSGGGGTAKQSARAQVMGEIFKGQRDERNDERTIDGQVERVA